MSAVANVLTMPVVAPKKRVVRSRCAHLEADQLEAFMTAAKAHGTREWAMFIFAFSHGARASEICDLRWSDVNFRTKQVTIARKKHSLEQTQALLKVKGSAVFDEEKALRAWRAERPGDGDDFVFNSQRSTKLNRVTVWKLFAKIETERGPRDTRLLFTMWVAGNGQNASRCVRDKAKRQDCSGRELVLLPHEHAAMFTLSRNGIRGSKSAMVSSKQTPNIRTRLKSKKRCWVLGELFIRLGLSPMRPEMI